MHQATSASQHTVGTEVVAASPVGWELHTGVSVAPTACSGLFCCAEQAPIAPAEFRSPMVLFTTAEPRLPADDFTFTLGPCVPPGKSPGAFIPQHATNNHIRVSKQNGWRSTGMLSKPCLALPSLLPKGSPAANPCPGAGPWGQQQMLPGSEVPWFKLLFLCKGYGSHDRSACD